LITNNKNIIIEQMQKNYTNKSVVKNIDTAFSYYKFPPSTTVNEFEFEDFDLDFDIDQAGFDPVSGMHRVPERQAAMVPGDEDRIKTSQWEYLRRIPNIYADVEGEPVWNGGSYYGFTDIPFKQTIDGNKLGDNDIGFIITPDIKKLCQEGKKTIKFTVVLDLQADATGIRPFDMNKDKGKQNMFPNGQSTFLNCEVQLRLVRTMTTQQRSIKVLGPTGFPIYDQWNPPVAIMQWDYYGAQVKGDAGKGVMRTKHATYRPKMRLEYIVDIEEAENYDIWKPQVAGQHNIFFKRPTSYWLIELIDDPGVQFADPNKRKKFYGKQRTNPESDRFWTTKAEREKNSKYNESITARLDAAPEIKARKNEYAKIKAKNQNVKAGIAKTLKAKQAVLNGAQRLRYASFRTQVNTQLIAAFPDARDLKYLIWSSKNDIPTFYKAVLEGFEVIERVSGGRNAKLNESLKAQIGTPKPIKTKGSYDVFDKRKQPGNFNAGTPTINFKAFYSGASKFTKATNRGSFGTRMTLNTPWDNVSNLDKRSWAEGLRQFALTVYNSAPAAAAATNKAGKFWEIYINKNGGSNLLGNLKDFYSKQPSVLQPKILAKLESDSSIRNQFYYIPDFGDGINHSESSGDGDFNATIQGDKKVRPYQLGSFADSTWGADIYKG
jgi:hypothetical protein